MAARGSQFKEEITQKILEMFDGAFLNGKELRIPGLEDGGEIQIKVALTCAKENVDRPAGDAEPKVTTGQATPQERIEVTEEEKIKVQNLIKELNL